MGSRRLRLGCLQFDLPGKVDCRLGSIWLESKTPATKQVARTRKFAFENERVTFKEILSPGDGKTFPQVPCACNRVDLALPHTCRYLFLRLCPCPVKYICKDKPSNVHVGVCFFVAMCVCLLYVYDTHGHVNVCSFACVRVRVHVRVLVCVCVCVRGFKPCLACTPCTGGTTSNATVHRVYFE